MRLKNRMLRILLTLLIKPTFCNSRRITAILLFMVVGNKLIAQNMVAHDILQRVFCIRYGDEQGTGFLVSINNNDYIVTARHLFPSTIISKTSIDYEILNIKGWNKMKCKLLFHTNAKIDIAVLDLQTHTLNETPFEMSDTNYFLSQECFFLGFPFGLRMDDEKGDMNSGFPLPFVKKGIISSFMTDQSGIKVLYLDGHNNPGFSGGPAMVYNNDSKGMRRLNIIGIVTGYLNQNTVINTPMGQIINSENSGIIQCYSIGHVFEIIKINK